MSDFDRDTWATPQYLFDWLNSIYFFNVDLCANDKNKKVKRFFCKDTDSLSVAWSAVGGTGFCNPPYSKIKPWIEKAIYESKRGFVTVMLIPTPNGESYYSDIFEHARSITFITGRIAFYNPLEEKEVGGNTRGSCVVEFSNKFDKAPPIINHVVRDELKELFK